MTNDDLIFMMGEFEATFPTDRRYAKNHMWAKAVGQAAHVPDNSPARGTSPSWQLGFTAYAVRLLQDVYFLDWEIDPQSELTDGQLIGAIESSKAESSLYAPMPGLLTHLNSALLNDPSTINVDKYGRGWLFEMEGTGDTLLSPQDYIEHLTGVWEVTQKTIKGQLNQ